MAAVRKMAFFRKIRAGRAHSAGCQNVSGGSVAIVPAGSRRHRAPTHEAKADGTNARGQDAGRQAMQGFRCKHHGDTRPKREDQRSASDHHNAGRGQRSFPGGCVSKRATRDLSHHAGDAADRQRKSNGLL